MAVAVLDAIEARALSFRRGEASSIDEKSASDSARIVSSAVRDTDVSLASSAVSSAVRMGCVPRSVSSAVRDTDASPAASSESCSPPEIGTFYLPAISL